LLGGRALLTGGKQFLPRDLSPPDPGKCSGRNSRGQTAHDSAARGSRSQPSRQPIESLSIH
jgi:hypothetical protein